MKNKSFEAYQHASFYEIFMCRALRTHDNSKPGVHCSVMENLINAENGDTKLEKFLGSFEKQFEQTKKYMNKAMDKYLTMKNISDDDISTLRILKFKIGRCYSSAELMDIIYQTLDLTQAVKEF